MTLENFNPDLKIETDAYAWRYMNFDKIWDLLINNSIYFSRLDTFHDPMEGLTLQDRSVLQTLHILKCELPKDEFAKFYKDSIKTGIQEKIKAWKNGIYCSCWYLTELNSSTTNNSTHHELLAMWNFLKDGEGFVMKISFQKLLTLISDSLATLHDEELVQAKFGKVYYVNYNEHSKMLDNTDGNLMPSLIKHNAYSFENELRFLLLREKLINIANDRVGIKIKFNERLNSQLHKIEIIAHPNMTEEDFKFYTTKFAELGFDLKVSSLLTKQSINQLFA